MKIKTDMDELEVPQYFVELFKKAKKEALSKKEDLDFWNQDENNCFYEWFMNEGFDFDGEIVDRKIAEFLVSKAMNNIAFGGGYPKESWLSFKDNGFEYTICAFGWSSDLEDKNLDINMIGYKEKL